MNPFLNRFNRLGVAALTLVATTPTFADNLPDMDRGHKEDARFESQHGFKLFPLFADGILGAQYTGTHYDGKTEHGVNLRFESNPFSMCKSEAEDPSTNCLKSGLDSGFPGERVLFFPVQFTARVSIDPKDGDPAFQVNRAKVDVARILFNYGFSLEALGYLNQFVQTAGSPFQGFRMNMIDIVDIKVTENIQTASPNFELTFQLRAAYSSGWMSPEQVAKQYEFDNTEAFKGNKHLRNLSVGGTFGFRIHKRVLAEVFGGLDLTAASAKVGDKDNRDKEFSTIKHAYVGGRLSARVLDSARLDLGLDLNASVQKDYYIGVYDPSNEKADRAVTSTGGFALHY